MQSCKVLSYLKDFSRIADLWVDGFSLDPFPVFQANPRSGTIPGWVGSRWGSQRDLCNSRGLFPDRI